ncbi:MAG: SAM-dependent methyltransferase, partial [Dysgonamonadaceae bacterium]|nr:SAM-dependent methyltransferase [Dysgonamonadaceae bacterium]
HLYTSKELIDDFPGRIFKIEKVVSPNKKQLKSQIPEIKKANIAVRNFPMSVEKIRKLTDLKDGGDHYIFATTLYDEKKVFIICSKI